MKETTWRYLGHWESVPLTSSLFAHYYSQHVFKKHNLPAIKEGYKVVDGEVFMDKEGWDALEQFFYAKMKEKDFEYLFTFISDAKKSAQEFLTARYDYSSLGSFHLFLENLRLMMCYWLIIHQIDEGITKALREKCAQEGIELYPVLGQIKHEGLEFMERDAQFAKLASLHQQGKLTEQDISTFLQKYSWTTINVMWGTPLSKEKVREELRTFEPPLHADIKPLDLHWPELKVAEGLAFLRFHFIESLNKIAFHFWPWFETLARQQGLTFEEMVQHTLTEIRDKQFQAQTTLRERMKGFGIIVIDGEEHIFVGNELAGEKENIAVKVTGIDHIKGMPASLGKAKGKVKLLKSVHDFHRMNPGDILVVSETTPDYVPVMKLAGAVVTDLGGVTSHAAIVCREMKKPCVIGTKIATKVLQEGEEVEVDAEKGVVRKLS